MKAKVWAKAYLALTRDLDFEERLGWLMALNNRATRLKLVSVLSISNIRTLSRHLDMPKPIVQFIGVLFAAKQDRLIGQIYDLVNEFLVKEGVGQGVRVYSAEKLTSNQLDRIKQQFQSKILIENIVKPGLLGGIQVKAYRGQVDKTFQSSLVQLQEILS